MAFVYLLQLKHHIAKFPFWESLVIHSKSSKSEVLIGFLICFSNMEIIISLLFAVICTEIYMPATLSTIIRVHGRVLDNKITLMLSQAAGWKMLADICLKASIKKKNKKLDHHNFITLYDEDNQI